MKQITIHFNQQPIYQIVLSDSFKDLTQALEPLNIADRKLCIVSDTHVAPHYLEAVSALLEPLCRHVVSFVFDAGEASKNLDTVQNLYEYLINEKFERRDLLVALGGGVVGDLTGFTAATYLRGIDFIQIPTSLLAQVDSSIGGKTGVDFRAFKNMVGAFHQPKLVYTNVATLKTLTPREFRSGLGEIIKHGLIKDIDYYQWLKTNHAGILALNTDILIDMIETSCHIKQQVVENDPYETGERALLNFGHTLGHAVEKLMHFSMLHGECVAVGMHAATWISYKKSLITKEAYEDILNTLQLFQLPITAQGLLADEIVTTSKSDKKMDKGVVKFILLKHPGCAIIDRNVTDALLQAASEQLID